MVVLHHARHVQVLDHDNGRGFRQHRRDLMERVLALVGNLAMLLAEFPGDFLPIVAAYGLARDLARCKRLRFFRRPLRGLGLATTAPSESVASVLTPRSTPTTGPVFAGTACSCSTSTQTFQ